MILRPTPQDYDELLTVWEASVRSTHHFLAEKDIQFYKPLIREQYFLAVELYIIRNEKEEIAAFMGLSDELIEMLFVRPDQQGKGYGKRLMEYAVHQKHIHKVDVNEQNGQACRFYQHMGFQVAGRDETDPTGKPFEWQVVEATGASSISCPISRTASDRTRTICTRPKPHRFRTGSRRCSNSSMYGTRCTRTCRRRPMSPGSPHGR